jgi:hypothetical protein
MLVAGAGFMAAACAVGGYGGPDGYVEGDVGYVGGYYEPWGYEYGGWGGRYHVGPPRGNWGHEGGRPPSGGHPVHGGRPAPSIPGRPRR